MWFRRIALVIIVVVCPAGLASAQAPIAVGPGVSVGVGAGVGPWVGPRVWPWFGPGLWGWGWWPWWWSGAAGSFWTNGLSLYGPPVPTFAPVPGVFGAGDAHRQLASGPVGLYDPWFWTYPRIIGPAKDFPPAVLPPEWRGPLIATKKVKQRYAEQRADPMLGIERADQELARGSGVRLIQPCLRLLVRVPTADTQIWVQGEPMMTTGTARLFESPPLRPGLSYTYTVTAKMADGRTESRTISGKPGETVAVEFIESQR
jgi:uncharacterized protein (TIGR03000 family)